MVWKHNLNPVFLHLGPVEIRYYGLFYVIGLIVAYLMLKHFSKKGELDLDDDDLLDFILYAALGILLGSRIFYFIFYNFPLFLKNPLQLFYLWEGGMSFHGGVIGVAVAGIIFCKVKKKDFFEIADVVVLPLTLALALGRVGNFINGELYGRPTSLPWAMDFGDGVPRHPSQLYESAKNLFMFTVLWITKSKILPKGFRFWLFIFMYGALRFTIEFVREPDPQLGLLFLGLSMGQWLSSAMILTGSSMLWRVFSSTTRKTV